MRAEARVVHPCLVAGDVAEGFACRLVGVVGLESLPDKVEASVLEGVALLVRPGSGEVGAGTVHGPGDLPEVFLRMEQVDDLDSVREELVGEAPDPAGAIAQDDAPPGVVEAAPARLARDPLREGGELGVAHGGTLDRRAGRGRAGIPHGPAGLRVAALGREDDRELDLAGPR